MMVKTFFEKLAVFHNSIQFLDPKRYSIIDDVLCRLYDIAESNSKNPGELPNKLFLNNIWATTEDLKNIFDAMGYRVIIDKYCYDFSRGYHYFIEII